ncbi:MAG: hypothetical protein EPO13_06375 [Actinomycetota bacterium]|nr:MAG: hypothetical protein EPO13_06375 [Actinomycetota bacterium]
MRTIEVHAVDGAVTAMCSDASGMTRTVAIGSWLVLWSQVSPGDRFVLSWEELEAAEVSLGHAPTWVLERLVADAGSDPAGGSASEPAPSPAGSRSHPAGSRSHPAG